MPFRLNPGKPFAVTGLPNTNNGHPEIRLELRELKKDKDLWNLYILGLSEFQRMPEDDFMSYFQIAGIHGLPHVEWPIGDKKLLEMKQVEDAGFCTHSSVIFLPWHRPYLALFEFVLYKAVEYVAAQFTEQEGRSRYVAAAKRFRIPYWDWALSGVPFLPDEVVDSETVAVTMPESMKKEYSLGIAANPVSIHNPLYSYAFQKGTDKYPEKIRLRGKKTTIRWQHKKSNEEQKPEAIKKLILEKLTPYSQVVREKLPGERNLRERVVYVLQSYQNFAQASSNHYDPERPKRGIIGGGMVHVENGMGFGSIEDFHNAMHNITGGSGLYTGHMNDADISAFDPIFWLHHTNIDRHFTIWQALHDNPDDESTYVTELPTTDNTTWITPDGGLENIKTELVPFYKDANNFWDSEGVRSAATFGHAYPETQDWKFSSKDEYRADITQKLKELYPRSSLGNMILSLKADMPGSGSIEDQMKSRAETLAKVIHTEAPNNTATLLKVLSEAPAGPAFTASEQQVLATLDPITIAPVEIPTNRTLASLAPENKYLEWMVNVRAQKHALGGMYSVHIFLDDVQEQTTSLYTFTPNHVGTFYPFGRSADTGCEKCQKDQQADANITGQIPLTIALVERYLAGLLDSLQPADVVPYLAKNLHWRVVDGEGDLLSSRADLPDLLLGVSSNEVSIAGGPDQLPQYSPDITLWPEITTNLQNRGRGEGTGITLERGF